DIRNTKVMDIYRELREFGAEVDVYDPWADPEEVYQEYGVQLLKELGVRGQELDFNSIETKYDAIILATAHTAFSEIDIRQLKKENSVVFDAKGKLPRQWVDARL